MTKIDKSELSYWQQRAILLAKATISIETKGEAFVYDEDVEFVTKPRPRRLKEEPPYKQCKITVKYKEHPEWRCQMTFRYFQARSIFYPFSKWTLVEFVEEIKSRTRIYRGEELRPICSCYSSFYIPPWIPEKVSKNKEVSRCK